MKYLLDWAGHLSLPFLLGIHLERNHVHSGDKLLAKRYNGLRQIQHLSKKL